MGIQLTPPIATNSGTKEVRHAIRCAFHNQVESIEYPFRIKYKDKNGSERTYCPDFFINKDTLIEIKPIKLWNTLTVIAKKLAAEEFCKLNGWDYKLIDIQPNSMILKDKYLKGEIRFVEKYKQRFEKYAKI